MFNVSQINGSPNVWVIPDSKFNEVSVSMLVKFPLEKKTATVANVLTKIMGDRLIAFPTKKAMTSKLDMLYGTVLRVNTYSMGQAQILEIHTRAINKRYVDEDLLKEQFELILECLLHPLINENTFKEAVLNVEKDLMRIKENPQYFALLEALSKAGPNQVCGIHPDGTLEDLKEITQETLAVFHKTCVDVFEKEIYVVGDVKIEDIPKMIHLNQSQSQECLIKNQIQPGSGADTQPSNQTELVMVYSTDIHPDHPLYYAYLVFIAHLGQGTSSLLFQNVREKHSLCYSIYASQLIFDGLFYISTSINPKNESKVVELVKAQIESLRTDNLDLSHTKAYLINQLSGTSEDLRRLGQFAVRNNMLHRNDSPETLIEAIQNVTPESIQAVLNYISEPFIYSYRGQDDETN